MAINNVTSTLNDQDWVVQVERELAEQRATIASLLQRISVLEARR